MKNTIINAMLIFVITLSPCCRTTSLNQSARINPVGSHEINGTFGFNIGFAAAMLPMCGINAGLLYRFAGSQLFEYQLALDSQISLIPQAIASSPYSGIYPSVNLYNQFKINVYSSYIANISLLPIIGFHFNYYPTDFYGLGWATGFKIIGDYSLKNGYVFYYGLNIKLWGNCYSSLNLNSAYTYAPEINAGFTWGWEVPNQNILTRHEFCIGTTFTPPYFNSPSIIFAYSVSIGKLFPILLL